MPNKNETALWRKALSFFKKMTRDTVRKALVLYYCMKDSDSPLWVRAFIAVIMAYLALPVDIIPDLLPGGLMDDLGALTLGCKTAAPKIKETHTLLANNNKIMQWI